MINYVLITPARNEESFIVKTIESVIVQTRLPKKWIIVSDGSTDRTDEIVNEYMTQYNFIELLKKKSNEKRNFGSKAKAISIAYNKLRDLDFEFVGNLDADVSFDAKYYENIFIEFNKNSKLGIAGGIRYDLHDGKFKKLKCAPDSVGGPFQLFRRECYEEIGGYKPSRFGGIDAMAEISARMKGWEVKMFPQYKIFHHRQTGTAINNVLKQKFRAGLRNYSLGYHPIFLLMRFYKTILLKPYFLGSLIVLFGYLWGTIRRFQRPVSKQFVRYLRSEQTDKMKSYIGLKD
ncbi:MAG: glycosyltransferase, partial [Ignavibacterium sp.]